MTYEKSFKIGSNVEGYIKCSFTTVYAENGDKLFTFNRKGFGRHIQSQGEADLYLIQTNGVGDAPNTSFDIEVDYPLLHADYGIKGKELVPVRLTQEAARFIASKLKPLTQKKYLIYRVYDNYAQETNSTHKPGERRLMQETYTKPWIVKGSPLLLQGSNCWVDTDIYHHEVEVKTEDQTHYVTLRDLCENYKTAIAYVRPESVDWIPTKIDNVTVTDADGKEIKLDVAIDEAYKKMEQAKSLLIAAGAASLIL